MGKKIFSLLVLLLIPLYLFSPRPLAAQNSQKSAVYISVQDSYVGGVIEFSSIEEPKIQVSASDTSGPATLEIYQATADDVLNYLVHDDAYQQLNFKVDSNKLIHLTNLSLNLTDKKQDVSLPISPSGIFYTRLKMGNLESQTFIVRSTFGTLAREAKDSLVLWSQDFTTKRSVVGGKATLYSLQKQKSVLGTANLDGDAIASLPLSNLADVAIVESQDSISIVPLNARYLNGYYSWLTFRQNLPQKRYFIFTDRPIYKPGDLVRFKAIVRDDDDARYSMPSGTVNVEVSQGWERKIYLLKDTLSIDANGFVSTSFTIPKTATTGDYQIRLNPASVNNDEWTDDSGKGDSLSFKVENYRKPEYFISADSSQIDVVRGDTVAVKLGGAYYSGQPLNGAKVSYKIYSSDFGYYDSEYYYPDNGNSYYRGWNGSEIDTGEVVLDAKGKATITLPTNKNDSLGKHQVYFFEFNYVDDTGNPSSTGVNVLVRSGDYSLYRDGYGPYGSKPNERISLPLQLKSNRVGQSLSQKIAVNISRNWWEEVKNPDDKYSRYIQKNEVIGDYSLTTDSSGKTVFDFTPQKSGSYDLKTEIVDSRGNKIIKTFSLWVSDQYYYYSNSGNSSPTLRLNTDKKTYRSGDTAIVSLSSDVPDRDVFLAFERGYQDRYQIVHLNGKEGTVNTRIYNHDAPNVYLIAKTFNSDSLVGGVQNISIDTSDKHAYFTLKTDKQNYAPGDEVTVNINAKDIAGNPLETNFALWSVDKAIFALTDKNYGDVFKQFWNDRYNGTSEANSLEGIMVIPAAEKGGCFLPGTKITMADNSEKAIETIKVGDQVLTRLSDTSSKLVKTTVTATHSTTASDYLIINQFLKVTGNHLLFINQHWRQAGLVQIGDELTSRDGQQIKVASIERLRGNTPVYNLTTAVYHTYLADSYYVHNQKGGAPRDNFADTAYWNVSVNTNTQGNAQVKFKLPDNLTTWVITALGASVDTKVGEAFTEIKVNKDLVIRPALPNVLGDGDQITVSALVNNFTDMSSKSVVTLKTNAGLVVSPVSQTINIAPNDFSVVSWNIQVGKPGTAKFEFAVKDDHGRTDAIIQNLDIRSSGYWQQSSSFKIGSANLDVSLPSLAFDSQKSDIKLSLSASILGSLPSAMTYLINYPYGCTEQTTSGLLPKLIAKKYPTIFTDALKQQSKYSTVDDGIAKLASLQSYDGGWSWWWGQSNSFVTAYVYRLLTIARSVGVNVDESLFTSAKSYFVNNFDNDTLPNKVAKAYGLSFTGDSKLYKAVTTNLDSLENDYLAMAVVANINAGIADPDQNGLNLLLSRAQFTTNGIYWTAGGTDRFGSIESSTALAVQALIKSNSHQSESAKAINYLMRNRRFDYWASTYGTAQTILAVTDFSLLQKESDTNLSYSVALSGKVIASGKFTGVKTTPIEVAISPDKVGKNGSLEITTSGNGELYSTLTQKWWLKDQSGAKASHDVTITKKIVNHKGEQYNLVPGDLADVILTVTFDQNRPENNGYAIIEDHLPSGLIPVNTHLNNESSTGYSYDNYYRQYLVDGVIIPVYYGGGGNTYTYQARVISGGTFNVPPAYYGLMYYPETWARSDSGSLTVDSSVKVNPIYKITESLPQITKNSVSVFRYVVLPVIFLATCGLLIYVKKKKVN